MPSRPGPLAAFLGLAVLAAALYLVPGWTVTRTVGAGAPVGNGDVNGDGTIDLADAVALLVHLYRDGPPPVPIQAAPVHPVTVLVVRHAEKEDGGGDAHLTDAGKARAAHLADILARTALDGVFATSYNRTVETVQPTATAKGLQVVTPGDDAAIIAALRALAPGSTVLLAGNSFNVPQIIAGLGVQPAVTVPSAEFDNLWSVTLGTGGEAVTASLVHLRY
jgi:hypothetical protein